MTALHIFLAFYHRLYGLEDVVAYILLFNANSIRGKVQGLLFTKCLAFHIEQEGLGRSEQSRKGWEVRAQEDLQMK